MSKIQTDVTNGLPGSDILSEYQKRMWSLFTVVFVSVFLPGSIFIYFDGFKLLGGSVLCLLGLFALNSISGIRNKAPNLIMSIIVASLMAVVGVCLFQRGLIGVFWTFPIVLFINFLTFGRFARIYTAVFFAYVAPMMFYTLEAPVAARAVVGLAVTILITNIFLGMIHKLQKKLVEQSSVDPLTGALNRREMDLVLQDAIERKRRTLTPATLLVLDIDEFKSVNDTYGHAVGDHVLKEFVSLIQSRARHLDRVFRIGGEEFMILLPDTAGNGAATVAQELCLLIQGAELIDDRVITVSIGISELKDGETIDQWLKRGDDALFDAKRNGRNQAVERPLSIAA